MNLVKETVAQMKGIPEEKELVEALQKAIFDKKSKEGTVTVWDINAKGGRSFRYDRVTKAVPCIF